MKAFNKSSFIALAGFALVVFNANVNAADFGSYQKLFAANSIWNSKPVKPVLGTFEIPKDIYYPSIHEGDYSTGCFLATNSDQEMVIKPTIGKPGINDADAEIKIDSLTVPHWPADLVPASGGDGHADIIDVSAGVIYSFWQLKKVDNVWRATHYGWMPLNGSGWADPAHYHQGSRAAGIPACAGLIRKHEVNDGSDLYNHALAMSLTKSGLSGVPPYTFPATIADWFASQNLGQIPEGSLLMLPPEFDIGRIKTSALKKIANTLKTYGAYAVDYNFGTPYMIYVEQGSGINIHKNGWNSQAANELQLIRQSLRSVTSVSGYIDGEGKPFIPEKKLNILSMRGPWCVYQRASCVAKDPTAGKFDTMKQAVVFGPTTTNVVQSNPSGRSISQVAWAKPKAGERYKLTAITTGGGKLRLIIKNKQYSTRVDTYDLADGQSRTFVWPADDVISNVVVTSGVGASSKVSGTLVRVN